MSISVFKIFPIVVLDGSKTAPVPERVVIVLMPGSLEYPSLLSLDSTSAMDPYADLELVVYDNLAELSE